MTDSRLLSLIDELKLQPVVTWLKSLPKGDESTFTVKFDNKINEEMMENLSFWLEERGCKITCGFTISRIQEEKEDLINHPWYIMNVKIILFELNGEYILTQPVYDSVRVYTTFGIEPSVCSSPKLMVEKLLGMNATYTLHSCDDRTKEELFERYKFDH